MARTLEEIKTSFQSNPDLKDVVRRLEMCHVITGYTDGDSYYITAADEIVALRNKVKELKLDNVVLTKEKDTLYKEWENLINYRGLADQDINRLETELYYIKQFLNNIGNNLSTYVSELQNRVY